MNVNELQEDYDWREAFAYAVKPQPCAGDSAALDAVSIGDVTDIVAFSNGENDGEPWVGAFVLRDGRYHAYPVGWYGSRAPTRHEPNRTREYVSCGRSAS